jgi:predicted P-loop ATPase
MSQPHQSPAKLDEPDYSALEQCYIPRELADAAGIYRVNSLDGRDLVGRKGGGDYAGLVFPYRMPGEAGRVLYRLRLDHAPVDAATGKELHKYLTAPGERNRLYFPPCGPDLLADAALAVVITEGEKKALALWHAAPGLNGTGKPAFLPVALGGVWSFRTTTGIRGDAHGERVPEKGVLPDFDRLVWTHRRVTILFDANAATNPNVQAARRELARELTRRGAEVWLAELPPAVGVNGCDDFLYAYGLEKFRVMLEQAHRYQWREELLRSDTGKILRVLANALTALRAAPEWVGRLAYNEFHLRSEATLPTPWGFTGPWDEQQDRLLAEWLQHRGILVEDGMAAKAVETVARDRSFHQVREYLEGLVWDGTGRLDDWLILYLGAEPSDFHRAIGAKWMISAVARIYQPGCKADCCLIAEGKQGTFKSTAFRTLAMPWFSDTMPDLNKDADPALSLVGVWIVELPELDALLSSRVERARVKSFLSRASDHIRPPYGRRFVDAPRQCVFAGTINHFEYLHDETGARRFWPFQSGVIRIADLGRDRDQLWAEAKVRFERGEHWWLESPELIQAAQEEQEQRFQQDPWEQVVAEYIEGRTAITTAEILRNILFKKVESWGRADETRVGAILRRLRWVPTGKARPRVYHPEVVVK